MDGGIGMKRTIRNLVALLGHELRNPLGAISSGFEVLEPHVDSSEEGRWTLRMIEAQLHRITTIVDDALEYSRLSSGRLVLRPCCVSARDLISLAVESVRPLLISRQHHLETHLPEADLTIRVDSARLQQVIVNLLGNAARYTPSGGMIDLEMSELDLDQA